MVAHTPQLTCVHNGREGSGVLCFPTASADSSATTGRRHACITAAVNPLHCHWFHHHCAVFIKPSPLLTTVCSLLPLWVVWLFCVCVPPQGELAIWEKLSAIETNCTIEATLDACLARLTNKVRERPLNNLTSRIPSWLSMSTIGQQAVASWGNPLEAGASPGHRPWGSYTKAGLLAGAASWGQLPAVVQAQQVAAAARAAAAAARNSCSNGGSLGPGLSMGPGGCVAATCAELQRQHQQQQQLQQGLSQHSMQGLSQQSMQGLSQHSMHFGSELQMSPTGSCASKEGSSSGVSTNLEDGPATIDEAIAAMANAANLGGLHRGYSYTDAALHHANGQQHGNSPKHQQDEQHEPEPAQTQLERRGSGQAVYGGLSQAFGRQNSSGSSGGGSASPVGPPNRLASAGSMGSGGIGVPPTIHENMPDDKPPRVASWGTNDIADSVSDFPANGSSVAAAAAAADAAAAAVAAAYHARRSSGPPSPGKGLLVRLFDSKSMLEEGANCLPAIPGSESSDDDSSPGGAAAAAAAAAARQRAHGNDSRRSSLSSNSANAPSDVLGELDCCDGSVLTDIWSTLLPLATSALALEAVVDTSQGLDFIAP